MFHSVEWNLTEMAFQPYMDIVLVTDFFVSSFGWPFFCILLNSWSWCWSNGWSAVNSSDTLIDDWSDGQLFFGSFVLQTTVQHGCCRDNMDQTMKFPKFPLNFSCESNAVTVNSLHSIHSPNYRNFSFTSMTLIQQWKKNRQKNTIAIQFVYHNQINICIQVYIKYIISYAALTRLRCMLMLFYFLFSISILYRYRKHMLLSSASGVHTK